MMRGFDSIESMNADSLLVKRRRGSKRFVVAALVIGGLFFLVGILIGFFSHKKHSSSPESTARHCGTVDRYSSIDLLFKYIKEDAFGDSLRQYVSKNSEAGTPAAEDLSQDIVKKWTSYGLDRVYIDSHSALMLHPNQSHPNKVELLETLSGETVYTAQLQESPIGTDDNNNSGDPFAFNIYSPAGEITADVVYANYGRVRDFKYLRTNLSLELSGKIVIIRLGLIYAGNKVRNAQEFGASAIILYPDPAEYHPPSDQSQSTVRQADPTEPSKPSNDPSHPAGQEDSESSSWLPSTGIRHVPVQMMSWEERTPRIPCISIDFNDAAYIMRNLSGPVSPTSWHGALSVEYRVGPGFLQQDNNTHLQVRVAVTSFLQPAPLNNVIGVIAGSTEPDRYVLLGNHHDTAALGAVGAHSGSAVLDQLVSAFGQLLKNGRRPRRTLLLCSWDGGEQGNLGSSSWLQKNFKTVDERVVTYINIGAIIEGNYTLKAVTSPLLQNAVFEAAKRVSSPIKKYHTLYNLWLDRPSSPLQQPTHNAHEPKVLHCPGGVGDFSLFYHKAGVPIVDVKAVSDQGDSPAETFPLFHTKLDSVFEYKHFRDPGYKFTKAITQMLGILTLDLLNTTTLPLSVSRNSGVVNHLVHDLVDSHKANWSKHGIQTGDLLLAVEKFNDATTEFEKKLSSRNLSPLRQRIYNDQMMRVERTFIRTDSLPGRPSIKHVLCGPSITNEAFGVPFPGIDEALYKLDQGVTAAWDLLQREIRTLTGHIVEAANLFLDPAVDVQS